MKITLETSKKILVSAAIAFFTMSSAQSVAEGDLLLESHKFGKAKEVFQKMIDTKPTEGNYFLLGNAYLRQFSPDFEKAKAIFDKGLAADKKSLLNRIGLASIEMGKGNKNGATTELLNIAKDSKDKNAEVLYRIAEAFTMFDNSKDADQGIVFYKKAIDVASKKNNIPANYYYELGDAYLLKRNAGDAMSAYDRASEVAKTKEPILTRIGSLWFLARKYDKAQENLLEAIKINPNYAPAYKVLGDLNTKFQVSGNAAANYKKYVSLADKDPSTILEYAKLAFVASDFKSSEEALTSVESQITDVIKYRMKSYLNFNKKDYSSAKQNLDMFLSKVETSRVQASDSGLMGLILAGLNLTETDPAKKAFAQKEIDTKIAVAVAAKDETLVWEEELAKIQGGFATLADIDALATNPEIDALKVKLKANNTDTEALFQLAKVYEKKNDWKGASVAWSLMSQALPNWEPGLYQKAFAMQKANDMKSAVKGYDKFIELYAKATPEKKIEMKDMVTYAHYAIAYIEQKTNKEKALTNVKKSLEYNPTDNNAILLLKQLSK